MYRTVHMRVLLALPFVFVSSPRTTTAGEIHRIIEKGDIDPVFRVKTLGNKFFPAPTADQRLHQLGRHFGEARIQRG
jgi:hypothetical protein